MKVQPIPRAIFETTRSGFIQILHHCSASWKITPVYFLSWNLIPSKWKFQTFMWFGKNSPKILMSFETASQCFLKTLHHSVVSWEITVLYFFSWNFIWFWQKEPTEVENFKLSTAHVKFHQICTLIGSFYGEYIKFQLKKYRGVMSHDTENRYQIWKKPIYCFKNDKNLVNFHSSTQSLKNLHFDGSFSCKVYNVRPKKVRRNYLTWHWRVMQNLKKN